MTGPERERLRRLIDARRRELLADECRRGCVGCGCHLDLRTPGCKTCWTRHRNRRRWREDPEFRRYQHEARRRRVARRREQVVA